MNKLEFLTRLRSGLTGLPHDDIEERVGFYSEMIDDRMEEGLSEEEAVAQVGPVDQVISLIIAETPLTKLVKEKVRTNRRLRAWEIVLLIVGSPLWVPLLIAAIAVALSLYITLWALIICLWAVELSMIVGALGCIALGVILFAQGQTPAGLASFGTGVLCAGLSIFLFFGCLAASKGVIQLTKLIAKGVKSLFIGKEQNNE